MMYIKCNDVIKIVKLTLPKTTKYLSMSLVVHKGGFSLFHLFGVVSGMLQPLLACYALFRVVPILQRHRLFSLTTLQVQLYLNHRSSHRRCSVKKVLVKILQISQVNTCVSNKLAGLQIFQHKRFPVELA